ncbi:hypothetical protein LCGC14_0461540 [marine sediment metagenome]|uniref:Uncharacterized protein n=1 Tax=marine sediment metagenome TaxID=412755 RepID=A0A0F9V1P0_9ZZZZ
MKAYEMRRLKLEEQKVEHLKRLADSLRYIEEFVGGGFYVTEASGGNRHRFFVEPKRS